MYVHVYMAGSLCCGDLPALFLSVSVIYLYMYVTREVSNIAGQRCLQHFLDLYWKM